MQNICIVSLIHKSKNKEIIYCPKHYRENKTAIDKALSRKWIKLPKSFKVEENQCVDCND